MSVSPFLLLNLARRQSYAYAIGLYTRPEIKSWPDIKFCAHAHCVCRGVDVRCVWTTCDRPGPLLFEAPRKADWYSVNLAWDSKEKWFWPRRGLYSWRLRSKRLMRAFLQNPSAIVENTNDFPADFPAKFSLEYEPAVTSFLVVETFECRGPFNA